MITLAIFIILALTLYFYTTRKFKYWKKRGVKHDRPVAIFGNNIKGFLFLATVSQISEEQYWKYPNEKVVGFFRAAKPELIIRDPELAKRILITDFHHFYRRGVIPPETAFEPLLQNLFFADGDLWKLLRQRLTPTFTSGKLKAMFPLIVERAERLQVRVLTMANEKKAIDARELMARFTTDFIGAVAFGLDTDTLNEEDSSFRKLGNKMFKLTFFNMITALLKFVYPKAFKNLKILAHLEKDMNMLLGEIIRQRNGKPSGRNDFIDLLLECKLKGKIIGESIEKRKEDGTPETATLEFNDSIIVAQVFVFFAAGFETSSISTSYALHQLAYNPDFQKKAQNEIDRVLKKHDGRLSYDAIKEMVYLEWIFKEALRLVPPLGFLIRQCVKPYHFPELNLSIDEGVNVLIPIQAMQTDPKYFEEPAEFRPERHDPKKFDSRNKYVYLPFGEGPRSCIGERLALMQSLAGLTAILAKFSVEPAPETKRHPVISTKTGMLQGFLGGLPLLFRERPKAI